MKRVAITLATFLMMTFLIHAASPPEMMNYQGVLRDSVGNPLNGPHDMIFRFYPTDTGGSLLLTDTHSGGAAVDISAVALICQRMSSGSSTRTRISGGSIAAVMCEKIARNSWIDITACVADV